ncbi:MAG: hypothetical protein ABI634_07285 [Acidobacteriota bacterium]
MTFDERVTALAPLGFSERQTRFLVTVALHSGFCLRRHYTAFAGLKYGAGVRDFLDRLVARRLARRFQFRPDRGHVYHLHHARIYAAIHQDDNRNRRRTSPALVARKLMLLDYVLGEPRVDWHATEQDKVALFTTRLGIAPAHLPQRVYIAQRYKEPSTIRYFIHKLPIFLEGDSRVTSFVFLVTDSSGHAFEQFLADHLRLLNQLPTWRIVAVAAKDVRGLPACTAALRRFANAVQQPRAAEEVAALLQYFETQDLVGQNDITTLGLKRIDAWHQSRRRFAAPEFTELFSQWKAEGPGVVRDRGGAPFLAALRTGKGGLVTHELPIGYDRFGTRPGVS